MCDDKRWELGIETFKQVYGDVIPAPPREAGDFGRLCIEQQFAEVWSRDVMSKRDRRLSLLGVLIALGEDGPFRIHAESALANREITPTELNEVLVFLTPYVGYPRATKVLPIVAQRGLRPQPKVQSLRSKVVVQNLRATRSSPSCVTQLAQKYR